MRSTYYIGDVHGMAGLLSRLLRWIEDDAAAAGEEPRVGFLGDIVDRGPDSLAAMEHVCDTLERWPGSVLHLGNHDSWFLEIIERKGVTPCAESWVINGGIATVESYCNGSFDPRFFDVVQDKHPRHVEVLKRARLYTRNGPFTAVHAGMDPTIPIEEQGEETLLWIRSPFLDFVDPQFGPVIHGHTPVKHARPVVTENRISLDTGAYGTGVLACLALAADGRMRFVAATPDGVGPIEPVALDRGHGTLLDRATGPGRPPSRVPPRVPPRILPRPRPTPDTPRF